MKVLKLKTLKLLLKLKDPMKHTLKLKISIIDEEFMNLQDQLKLTSK